MNTRGSATRFLIANWKMNGNILFIREFIETFCKKFRADTAIQLILCPPVIYLKYCFDQIQSLPLPLSNAIYLGAQNIASYSDGAFTGEISGSMLKDVGATFVLIGHSERRNLFLEGDAQIASKVLRAYDAGLVPILCVGETLGQREAAQTEQVIQQQLGAVLSVLSTERRALGLPLLVAYEPVWAIGTGLTPTVETIASVHRAMRHYLKEIDSKWAQGVSIVYGGSVKGVHAEALWAEPQIEGLLVGGASLVLDELLGIYEAATV